MWRLRQGPQLLRGDALQTCSVPRQAFERRCCTQAFVALHGGVMCFEISGQETRQPSMILFRRLPQPSIHGFLVVLPHCSTVAQVAAATPVP